ncbi:zinc-ribbon domain-containing protein [Selenomonas sp.]
MYCQKCGKQMDDHPAFCPHCGAPAPGKAQEERTQKK